ncbi:MAG: hypothetical protein [Wendovervirus sonii]|uniref:Uncharacterized protein n=1 Tax=phage Lak_Megaphage_Sonny TaxID=3109229 RepID=A0ABZ0Z3Z9_9CAUD|nr:MAG: hypothetical protein [phage Lak_Megaphage_Sonny]
MDEFLRIVKDENISGTDAMEEIVVKLMQKNLKGDEKLDGHIGVYDSETQLKGKIYPGNIYIFKYSAEKPTLYSYKGKTVQYYDDMPVVLALQENSNVLSGINLNFCNKGLCTLILNLIQNLDCAFYNGGDSDLFDKGKTVISDKIISALNIPGINIQLYNWLQKLYSNADYSFIFRTYSKANIQNFRMIEPWQWKYIPSLNYHGTLKKDTLDAIQKISGIDKIVI